MIKKKWKTLLTVLFICLVVGSLPNRLSAFQTDHITEGEQLIKMMYKHYANKWYPRLTFKQKTSYFRADTVTRTQIWHEAMKLPDKLAIRFGGFDSGNGVLFRDGYQYSYRNNKMAAKQPRVHELLLLGFQIYAQSPDTTIAQLDELGFDLSKLYETTMHNRQVYVVGARDNNERVSRFVIDKERLLFIQLSHPTANGRAVTRFTDYRRLGDGWIAPTVIFTVNGRPQLREEYIDISIPDSLPDAIFNPDTFLDARW